MYNVTSYLQNNMVMNKGLLELGGYAIPGVIMSNNRVEAKEKAERSAALFSIAYLTPFVTLPFFNKSFLRFNEISNDSKYSDKILQVSKKYLTKDGKYLEEGINEYLDSLKKSKNKNSKEITAAIKVILEKFPDKEVLRRQLAKTHSQVLLGDFLLTGAMFGSVYWISNMLTKKATGKDGFSAKFEMEDKSILKEKAKNHEKEKTKKILTAIGLLLTGAFGLSSAVKKGILAKPSDKFGNFMKKHIDKFDYTDSIFMSRATLFFINLFGDLPNTLLASRDKDELKYNTIKNAAFIGAFFGGDLLLNNLTGRLVDKAFGTQIMDYSKLKQKNTLWNKINMPLRSFKEIDKNAINLDAKALKKTKYAGVAMFWWNFAVLCGIIGFGLPHVLNKILKNDVKRNKQ